MPQLATDLLLIARNPLSGRLRHRTALEKGLRAALFTELILAGRIGDNHNAPHALTSTTLDDRVLDTVLSTVAAKPGIAWRRWYHHVAADRSVLTRQLVADGRWLAQRDPLGRARYRDTAQDSSLELANKTQQLALLREQPADREQAVLAVLAVVCGSVTGSPRPRDLRGRLAGLLDAVGPPSDPVRRDVQAALTGCGQAIRHRARILP